MHERLKAIRKALNVKQYALADKLGITSNFLSELERGNRNIFSTVLLALDKIGVNLHWLITGQGEMFLTNSEIPLFQEKELNGKRHPILKEFQEIADIKNRFKLVRKTLELSQKDLGKKLGISENFVSAIEYGNKTVPPKIFPHLIELNVNLNWLLFGKGEMFTDGKKTLVNIADPTGTLSEAVKLLSALPEEKQIECIGYIKDKKLLLELQEKLRKDATF